MSINRRVVVASVMAALTGVGSAFAQAADPAASRIEAFYASLLGAMKSGGSTPAKLKALVEKSFNIPIMAQFAVGAPWTTMNKGEQEAIVAAITRYTATRYAREFPTFMGQKFTVTPASQQRGVDRLVKSEVSSQGDAPEALMYRLREYAGSWQIIDVYFNGISQLATQRSDFASSLLEGGAANLVRKLDEATSTLK
jgi:phospholipid transport system substrate-binding protein